MGDIRQKRKVGERKEGILAIDYTIYIGSVEGVLYHKNLDGGECTEDMPIMTRVCSERTYLVSP
jgi:hypothetical protein